jgi:hypothetical protein
VAEAYAKRSFERTPVLEPERDLDELADWLARRRESVLAIVGHEPLLSHASSWLLSGLHASFLEIETGGALLLRFTGEIAAGRARLVCALTPKQLRKLREDAAVDSSGRADATPEKARASSRCASSRTPARRSRASSLATPPRRCTSCA